MRAPPGAATQLVAVPVPVADAGSVPIRRRLIGLTLLALAVVAALAGSHLVGIGIVGRASAAPTPLPPPVGSCLLIDDGNTATVVGCDEPHTGELAMSWRAGVQPVEAGALVRYPHFSVTRSISDPHLDTRCIGWAERYTGWDRYLARYDADLWLAPQPLVVGRLVRPPVDPAAAGLTWSGCAVVTTEPSYVGSVRDTAFAPRSGTGAARPDAVSVCLRTGSAGLSFVSCDRPHDTELIGSVNLTQQMMFGRSVTLEHTAAEVVDECRTLAAGRIGRADPTFAGRLTVVAESIWQQSLQNQQLTSSAWLIPDCLVRVNGAGTLDRSLLEWGEAPLPPVA